jgi:hypothetical protein
MYNIHRHKIALDLTNQLERNQQLRKTQEIKRRKLAGQAESRIEESRQILNPELCRDLREGSYLLAHTKNYDFRKSISATRGTTSGGGFEISERNIYSRRYVPDKMRAA